MIVFCKFNCSSRAQHLTLLQPVFSLYSPSNVFNGDMPIRQRSQVSGVQSTASKSPHSHWKSVLKFGHGSKEPSKKYSQPTLQGAAPAPPSVQIHGPDYDDDPDSPRGATPTNDRGIDPMRASLNDISEATATDDAPDSPATPAYPYEIDIRPSPIVDEPYSDHSESPTASSES